MPRSFLAGLTTPAPPAADNSISVPNTAWVTAAVSAFMLMTQSGKPIMASDGNPIWIS